MTTTNTVTSWLGVLAGLIVLGGTGCTGDFHTMDDRREMQCDATGCWHCDDGICEEYRCDETHQCPMQTFCSADRRCLPGDGDDGSQTGCRSHDDCPTGEVCTLDGACVTRPGSGDVSGGDTSSGDASGGDATSGDATNGGDTAGPDTDLPQHPDDVCLSNADCGLDGTCINGECFFGCRADGSCPPGQECTEDGCRARTEVENACTFNGECGTNHLCREGTCFRLCEDSTTCGDHERCSGGLCIADTLPVIQCSGPNSCLSGEGCVDGKCVSPCSGAGACDSERQSCEFGFCMPAPVCFDASDCAGADCVDGTCAN